MRRSNCLGWEAPYENLIIQLHERRLGQRSGAQETSAGRHRCREFTFHCAPRQLRLGEAHSGLVRRGLGAARHPQRARAKAQSAPSQEIECRLGRTRAERSPRGKNRALRAIKREENETRKQVRAGNTCFGATTQLMRAITGNSYFWRTAGIDR